MATRPKARTSLVETVGRFERHRPPEGGDVYFDPSTHRYFDQVKPNKRANGGYSFVQDAALCAVSTPSKMLDGDPDPLMGWAAKLDQIGVAALASAAMDAEEPLDWLTTQRGIAEALYQSELTWRHVRDRMATRGINVHELIFLALGTGRRPPSLDRLSKTERAFGQAAMSWWMTRKPVPLFAEHITLDAENRVAGRFDLLCEIDGERVLVDAKTRDKGQARKGDHVQLAGYELCNQRCGIGHSDRQVILLLKPDGKFVEKKGKGEPDDFLVALDAHRHGADLGKRITK